MMSEVINYAVVDESGEVINLILWDGESEFDAGESLALYPAGDAQIGWTYANGDFTAPPAPVIPPPTASEILATNMAYRDQLFAAATLAIGPLQDATDLDDATADETALLKQWKQFRVAVNRIDLTVVSPSWPSEPQTGYGGSATLAGTTDA